MLRGTSNYEPEYTPPRNPRITAAAGVPESAATGVFFFIAENLESANHSTVFFHSLDGVRSDGTTAKERMSDACEPFSATDRVNLAAPRLLQRGWTGPNLTNR